MTEDTQELNELPGEIKKISTPRLSPEEKLYVRVYLHTLSHPKAYEAVRPGLKSYNQYQTNMFSRRENVSFHISLGLQEKAEALTLSPELILEKLFKEATREGPGSNHAARIQALTQLGKHLGLFEEKKESTSHIFNIVNYSSTPLSLEAVEEETLSFPLETEAIQEVTNEYVESNINITDYHDTSYSRDTE